MLAVVGYVVPYLNIFLGVIECTLSAVDYMLERVGFCVCNLQSTIGSALRKSIAASNGVPVLDIAGSEGRG